MIKDQLRDELRRAGVPPGRARRVDYVLALIRVGTPEALAQAELMGAPLRVPPGADPPWPLGRTSGVPGAPMVVQICVPGTKKRRGQGLPKGEILDKTREQLRRIKVGMTRGQLGAVGISKRDAARWTKMGLLRWS